MKSFGGRSKAERRKKGKAHTEHLLEDTKKLIYESSIIKACKKSDKCIKTKYQQYVDEKKTKKKRRKLENIKKRRDQKKQRAQLYEQLKSNQIPSEQLACFIPTIHIGKKPKSILASKGDIDRDSSDEEISPPNSSSSEKIPNSTRKRKSSHTSTINNNITTRVYHIVNLQESSSSDGNESNSSIEHIKAVNIDEKTAEETLMDSSGVGISVPVSELANPTDASTSQNIFHTKPVSSILKSIVRKPSYVLVNRDPSIQKVRLQLPILGEEQMIMEEIVNNDVVIISGETGSGKTTQLPQFLYEAGYSNRKNKKKCMQGMIGITEPRRVAAIAMSERVGIELGFRKNECSYKIRHDGTVSANTLIKFMTDGVLIKEIESDFLLSNYSVIIIDEAHERSLHTDILLGLLSRIVVVRNKRFNPLKLIIMSATLQIEQFERNALLFPAKVPPVIKISSRQYPVSVHFSRKTPSDYMRAAYNQVCRIHKKNHPHGSILVFVTSHREVTLLCSWLRARFSETTKTVNHSKNRVKSFSSKKSFEESSSDDVDNLNDSPGDYENSSDLSSTELSENDNSINPSYPMIVFPMYANLASEKQKQVFQTPPENVRHCIVATNVAETSITIPNIKFVVDTGKVKQRLYDNQSSATTFEVCWCSKASAEQRTGRAGRVGPGHCYRLYSSAVYQYDMPDFTEPDILRQPLESVILQMKCLGIARVEDFPFPTPPSKESIRNAETLLVAIGALSIKEVVDRNDSSLSVCGVPTQIGKEMAKLPIPPRYSIMLLKAVEYFKKGQSNINIIFYVIILIASLSVRDLVLPSDTNNEDNTFTSRLKWISKHGQEYVLGDFLFLIKMIGASLHYDSADDRQNYCNIHRINFKSLVEVYNLVVQLKKILKQSYDCTIDTASQIPPPSSTEIDKILDIIICGFPDHIARKMPKVSENGHSRHPYQCGLTSADVFIHPSSVLSKRLPRWVLFVSLHEASKLYLNDVCAIDPERLIQFNSFCRYEISKKELPIYDHLSDVIRTTTKITYGPHAWPLPTSSKIQMKTDNLEFYKIFTMFFLDGTLFTRLKQYNDFLMYNPKNLASSDRIYNKTISEIIDSFIKEDIHSKKALIKFWKKSTRFLLDKYVRLLPETLQMDVESIWPPIGP